MPSRPPLPRSASASVLNQPKTMTAMSTSDIEIDMSGLTMGSRARNNPQSMSSSNVNTDADKPGEVSIDFSGLMLGSKSRNKGPPPIPTRRADSVSSADSDVNIVPASSQKAVLSPRNPFATDINKQVPQENTSGTKPVSKPGPPPIPSRSVEEPNNHAAVPSQSTSNGAIGPAMVTNRLAAANDATPVRVAPQAQPRASMSENASKPVPPAIPSRSAIGTPDVPSRSAVEVPNSQNSSKSAPPPIPQRKYLVNENGS